MGSCLDHASHLDDRMDRKLKFSTSYSNNMTNFMSRQESMLADNPGIRNISSVLAPSPPADIDIDDADLADLPRQG